VTNSRTKKVGNIKSIFRKIGWSNENCDGGCEPSAFRFHMEELQQLTYVWNVLSHDYRTSRMGDFMLPSQPLAKWQHGIDHFFTHLSGMTTAIRRYIASQQMRWRQKITGQVFVLTLWNVSTTGTCRLRELQCNCQWIPINFQQLTYIGRCRKLERENDSAAAQGRHTNKKTCNHTPMLQLSSLPPAPTNQGTQQS
jgi:hypothetical protein